MKRISIKEAADLLQQWDKLLILTHRSPDGDTLGSGFGLWAALRQLGKQARILCSDPIPNAFRYLTEEYQEQDFVPEHVVAVDIADPNLMGSGLEQYQQPGQVDLCIDHHPSNTGYAKALVLSEEEAATCQLVYELVQVLRAEITPYIASALYTGIATDTFCFRFSNTQPKSHRIAADLIEKGADFYKINRLMFELKTRQQFEAEQKVRDTLQFACGGRFASLIVTQQLLAETGASLEGMEGLPSIPRSLEGVEVGVVLKEKEPGFFKVSVRTGEHADAPAICKAFGGGGHKRAAGCTIRGDKDTVLQLLIAECEKELERSASQP